MSGLLLDPRGVCIIRGKDFPNAVRGQLAAADLGLVPPACFKRFRSWNSSLKGTFHQDLQTGALTISSISACQCSFGEGRFPKPSRGAPGVQSAAMPLLCISSKMAAGVTQVAEKKGSAVRGSLTVIAFVAGVLPLRAKATLLEFTTSLDICWPAPDQSSMADEP